MPTTTHLAGQAAGGGGLSLRSRLFERVMGRIHNYFRKLVWDPHAVDDCLQRTLIRLDASLQDGSYDPNRSFNAWIWLKAHSVFVEYCREHARRPAPMPRPHGPAVPPQTEAIDRRLDAAWLLGKLRVELDPACFEAFVLYYGEGQSLSRVAALQGHDRKTVRKRLLAAKQRALQLYQPRADGFS